MSSPHGLALLCGVFLASFGLAHPTDVASSNMLSDIKKVEEHFKEFSEKDKYNWFGKALFRNISDILDDKTKTMETKSLLVGEMLEVSQNILSNLLKDQAKDEKTRMCLRAIERRVKNLQKDYFPAMAPEVRTGLQDLWGIKVDEFMTQLQGLRELKGTYRKTLNLAIIVEEKRKKRRRRRQALRGKMQQLL